MTTITHLKLSLRREIMVSFCQRILSMSRFTTNHLSEYETNIFKVVGNYMLRNSIVYYADHSTTCWKLLKIFYKIFIEKIFFNFTYQQQSPFLLFSWSPPLFTSNISSTPQKGEQSLAYHVEAGLSPSPLSSRLSKVISNHNMLWTQVKHHYFFPCSLYKSPVQGFVQYSVSLLYLGHLFPFEFFPLNFCSYIIPSETE